MKLNDNIPLTVNFELGRTKKKVADLLAVTKGTVFRLEESEAKIVSVMLENKKVAKGKILTKDGKIFVEIIELVDE